MMHYISKGATDYFSKPVIKEVFQSRVRAQLRSYAIQKNLIGNMRQLKEFSQLKDTFLEVFSNDLITPLKQLIRNNDEEIEDVRYEEKSHEYYIDALGIPTILKIDARYVRPKNNIYSLREVSWDVGSDGNVDATGKNYSFEIPTEGNHNLAITYIFEHRKDKENIIELTENLFVE